MLEGFRPLTAPVFNAELMKGSTSTMKEGKGSVLDEVLNELIGKRCDIYMRSSSKVLTGWTLVKYDAEFARFEGDVSTGSYTTRRLKMPIRKDDIERIHESMGDIQERERRYNRRYAAD